jgi:hypothetical protein
VTEISKRRESTVALLAARPKTIRVYNYEAVGPNLITMAIEGGTDFKFAKPTDAYERIEETDLLFIDNEHTYERTKLYLEKLAPSVRRFIILHDTTYHGGFGNTRGENGDQGLMPAIAEYLSQNREWSVVYQTQEEYGLTVLGRLDEDKPTLPPLTEEAKNLASSLWKVVKDYAKGNDLEVGKEEYEARIERCTLCEQRVNDRCASCGCFINEKARIASYPEEAKVFCPLVRWPDPKQYGRSDSCPS